MALHITPAERAALRLLASGTAGHEVARLLEAGETDLEARLAALFGKLGASTRHDALTAALRRGLLTTE